MTGSEKQLKWAQGIMDTTFKTIDEIEASLEEVKQRKTGEIKTFIKGTSIECTKESLEKTRDYYRARFEKMETAGQVIDYMRHCTKSAIEANALYFLTH